MIEKFLPKKSNSGPQKSRSFNLNNRGQAIVEYVLILVVVVGLALALMRVFYQPFDRYMKNYLGEYLMCILETAELPSMNSESPSGECENRFNAQNGSGGGAGGRGGGAGANGAGKDGGSDELSGSDGEAGGGGAGRSGRRGRGRSGNSGQMRFATQAQGGTGAVGEAEAKPEAEGGAVDLGNSKSFSAGRVSVIRIKRIRATGIGGAIAAEQEKAKKAEQKVKKVGRIPDDIGGTSQKKLRVKQSKRDVASKEISEEGFSFGKWIRYLFIVVMVLAIVVFLFMQLNNISKSWEK